MLVLYNFIPFNEKLLSSDKSKLRYNNSMLDAAVNVFKISNSFLNININNNGIKLALFQLIKILHNINTFFRARIYILIHSIYDVRLKLNLH